MRQQQRHAGEAVDAVPARQPVEADEPVEHRQAREQQQLDEHQVGPEQAADAAEPGQQARPVVDVGEPAGAPQPEDRGCVGEREERQARAGDPPAAHAHARSVAALARTVNPEYPRSMRLALRNVRYWLPLVCAFACLIAVGMVGPLIGLLLIIVALVLVVDVATALFAAATRTGGLPDHKS